MRDERSYLLDMLLAARKIRDFIGDMSKDAFMDSDLHQSAVIRELQVIGEAARLTSDETKEEHNSINWREIAGMRNRIIHEYFRVNLSIVWDTISENIPQLIKQLDAILPDD